MGRRRGKRASGQGSGRDSRAARKETRKLTTEESTDVVWDPGKVSWQQVMDHLLPKGKSPVDGTHAGWTLTQIVDRSRSSGSELSSTALSAWRTTREGRYPDLEKLRLLREVIGCRCAGFDEEAVSEALERARSASRSRTKTDRAVSRALVAGDSAALAALPAELQALWKISRAAASDADVVGLHPSGQELRLSGGLYVERSVERDVLSGLESAGCTVLVGEAGFGKTSLLWSMHRRLLDRGRCPLFLRASTLLLGMRAGQEGATAQGQAALSPQAAMAAFEQCVHTGRPFALLIDTVDLLMHSEDAIAFVVDAVRAASRLRLPTLLTCRPVEAQRLMAAAKAAEVTIKRRALPAYSTQEWLAAVESYARGYYEGLPDAPPLETVVRKVTHAASRGRALREVCANPFALRLLFDLYAPAVPEEDVDTPFLYDMFWRDRIERDLRARNSSATHGSVDLSPHTRAAARVILASGQLDTRRSDLESGVRHQLARRAGRDGVVREDVHAAMEMLRSRGVLSIRELTGYLWFFHQTFFEHAAARGVLACGGEAVDALMERVAGNPGDLYFGEVASEVLLMAGRISETREASYTLERADAALASWLASTDSALLGLALRVYAKLKCPGPLVLAHAPTALKGANPSVIDRFLLLLPSVTHPDLGRPLADLALVWNMEPSSTRIRKNVLEALVRLATDDPAAVEGFLRKHGCFEWLKSLEPSEWHHNDKLPLRVLSAVAAADPDGMLEHALHFWEKALTTGQLSLPTELLIQMSTWGLSPRIIRTTLQKFMSGLGGLHPDRQESIAFEQALCRLFLLSRPRAEDSLAEIRSVLGLPPAQQDDSAGRAEPPPLPGVLVCRATLRMHTVAIIKGLPVDPAELLDTVMSTRAPSHQLAVCYAVLAESLAGRSSLFQRDLRGDPSTVPSPSAAEHPLTVEARRRCRTALVSLPCAENSSDGVKESAWLWRKALQEAKPAPDVLLSLMPTTHNDLDDMANSPWLNSFGLCVFTVPAALAGRPEAVDALDAFVADRDIQLRLQQDESGRAATKIILGAMQYTLSDQPEVIEYLIAYAKNAAAPEVLHRTLKGSSQNPAERLLPGFQPYRQRLVDHRKELVSHRKPHMRQHGFMLWKVLLELAIDTLPTVDEILEAWTDASAQDLRNAILELVELTIPRRTWDADAPASLRVILAPLVLAGREARRLPRERATEQIINHEATARILLAMANVHLGALDRPDELVATVISLAEEAGYEVSSKQDCGRISQIIEPVGFAIERLIPTDPSAAAELTASTVRALHRIQPEDVKWKRDISRPWAPFLGRLCLELTPAQQERWVRNMMCEPAFCAPVVSAAAQLHPKPQWLDAVFTETETPDKLRESLRGSSWLHGRAQGRTGGWQQLLEYEPLY